MTLVCNLKEHHADACVKGVDIGCKTCGHEQHEAERRKEEIHKQGLSYDAQTGKYYLSIRKGIDNAGHDNE